MNSVRATVSAVMIVGTILLLGGRAGGIDAGSKAPLPHNGESRSLTPVAEPAAGRFLVARRAMNDPHFRQTVVYLLRHGSSGTVGLIINRRSGLDLSETVSGIDDRDNESRPVYFGGPVEFNTVSMLIRDDQESRLVEHIADGIYLSGDRSVLDRLLTERKPDNALHFYLGHAGWLPGQLAREIRQENWYVVDAGPALIFSASPERLWMRLIEKIDPSGLYAGSDRAASAAKT